MQPSQTVRVGADRLAFFTVTNNSDQPLTGRAVYNVTPEQAGAYFSQAAVLLLQRTRPSRAHTTVQVPGGLFRRSAVRIRPRHQGLPR